MLAAVNEVGGGEIGVVVVGNGVREGGLHTHILALLSSFGGNLTGSPIPSSASSVQHNNE